MACRRFFLLPIFGLGAIAAVYGSVYLPHAIDRRYLGAVWSCFHLLTASMVTVVLAANGLLFLVAWELTVLSSFVLGVLGGDGESNRRTGWIYLVASHLGTGFLIVLFLLMGQKAGSFELHRLLRNHHTSGGLQGNAVPLGARRLRHGSRFSAASRLAFRGAFGRPESHLRPIRHHDQSEAELRVLLPQYLDRFRLNTT